ncbi:MAG: hypothetical protein LBS77_04210 [Desulfovibrio sp.]|jgi:hypothetical protein|nr:hypothetical protein [Desulfovibrio sp.]
MGVFNKIFKETTKTAPRERVTIDATHLKANRTAASPLKKAYSSPHLEYKRWFEFQTSRVLREQREACFYGAYSFGE